MIKVRLDLLSIALAVGCGSSSNNNTPDAPKKAVDAATDAAPPGPGAGLICASSNKNAYETYSSGFFAVNNSIFSNVIAELGSNGSANLGNSFAGVGSDTMPSNADAFPTFESKLAALLVWAYGGPASITVSNQTGPAGAYANGTFSGVQNLVAEHSGFNITDDQYTYFVTNIVVPALTANGVPDGTGSGSADDVGTCFAPLLVGSNSIEADIVGH